MLSRIAGGNGWEVGRTATDADGYDIKIERADGMGYFGATCAIPADDAARDNARNALIDAATDEVELDRIEAAMAHPWVQG